MDTNDLFDITVQTIHMQIPILSTNNTTKRQSYIKDWKVESLISNEAFLRRNAYKNSTIKTAESFFDDSDMKSEYYLVIVYDKASNTPLLSARHYFDKSSIAKFIKGDDDLETKLSDFNPASFPDGKLFLADRLSGNISSSIYRRYRSNIFSLYYSELVNKNKNCTLLLMVRKEIHNKQLSKYLNLGFIPIGSTLHNGKEHTIIVRDFINV